MVIVGRPRQLGFLHAVIVPNHAHGRLVDAEAMRRRNIGKRIRLALRKAGILGPGANAIGGGASWPAAGRNGLLAEGHLEPGAGALRWLRAAKPQPKALVAFGANLRRMERRSSKAPSMNFGRTGPANGLPFALLQLALAPGALVLAIQLIGGLVEYEVRRRIGHRTAIGQASFTGVNKGRHVELGVGTALVLTAPHRHPADVLDRHLGLVRGIILFQILSFGGHRGRTKFIRIEQRLHAHLNGP